MPFWFRHKMSIQKFTLITHSFRIFSFEIFINVPVNGICYIDSLYCIHKVADHLQKVGTLKLEVIRKYILKKRNNTLGFNICWTGLGQNFRPGNLTLIPATTNFGTTENSILLYGHSIDKCVNP